MMCSRLEEEQVNNNATTTVVKGETLPDRAPIAENKFAFEMANGRKVSTTERFSL